jgi:hypothetical protein
VFAASHFVRAIGLAAVFAVPVVAHAGEMRAYETRYYTIHTDLSADDTKEACIRMTRMFEEYRRRTAGFSGEVRRRFDFYLFQKQADYIDAGGLPRSAGVFTGDTLMAVAGERISDRTWHVVQHEGFHQFAKAVIRGELPSWLNEGLAEYFGEAVFTGDSFVSGVIPPDRLRRLKTEIRDGKLRSLDEMMHLSHDAWNTDLAVGNYDQAWSMVHFLVHGDEGKYQQAMVRFIVLLGNGQKWQAAWQQTFGDSAGFEQRWRDWWMSQPADPTLDLYTQAQAETFASYLARAAMQKQRFDDFETFLNAAFEESVRTGQTIEDWLPPRLLQQTAERARRTQVKWSLKRLGSDRSRITADCADGVQIVTTFLFQGGQPPKVHSDVDDTALIVERARGMIASGDRATARKILQQAQSAHPRSAAIEQVRELLRQTQGQ